MAQAPFRHDLPTHAQIMTAREKAAAEAAAKDARLAQWRTIGIWAFGMVGSAMIGGFVVQNAGPFSHDPSPGLIAGPCIFGCARLWLTERRLRKP
jgi:hypothetical protein